MTWARSSAAPAAAVRSSSTWARSSAAPAAAGPSPAARGPSAARPAAAAGPAALRAQAAELRAAPPAAAELRAQVDELRAAAAGAAELRAQVDELRAAAAGAAELRAQVAGLRTAAAGAAELRAQVDELRAAAAGAAELRAQVDELRAAAAGAAELRAQVDDSTEEHQRQIEALQDLHAAASARFVAVEEQIIATDKRARAILSQLPKKLMIDRNGQLVAIDGEGECSIIGQVCGRDGVDGISVRIAAIVDSRFVLEMSDGRKLDVGEWPVASTVAPAADLDAELSVVARSLKADGMSQVKIRALFGVSRAKLKKWLDAGGT